ncbi:MAG: class I SAM-dependent methyltransferase [Deltaproteobacteria bacterium]|nr:MAG: class I SAM-dependent methyltransferase [Deltaproteobacteria bacterium]TMB24581.1 MAG: class I SAM-dependent methyltransferase [Deltaproteobacteria bacterium]
MTATYDVDFFTHIRAGAQRSARALCKLIYGHLHPDSVLDVGCGDGTWLLGWRELGVADFLGVDGSYVEGGPLLIESHRFRAVDLSQPLRLGRRFALVQSLEVAEHLARGVAAEFVDSLTRHSDQVLFSAAPPGQFGNDHLNERPYEYWRRQFGARGYDCFDVVRPALARVEGVDPWYRYNTFLYVSRGSADGLPPEVVSARVPDEVELTDSAPLAWRLRKALFRMLPTSGGTALARMSTRWSALLRRLQALRH